MEPAIFEKPKPPPEKEESSSSEEEDNGPVIKISERELNPHWKNGGDGNPDSEEEENERLYTVGDGGRGWARKAYNANKELAMKQGRTAEEVFAEHHDRWSKQPRGRQQKRRAPNLQEPPKKRSKLSNDDTPPGFHSSQKKPKVD